MRTGGGIVRDQIAFAGADADVHMARVADGQAAGVHLGGVHPAEVLHGVGAGIEPHEAGLGIRAGVDPSVGAGGVLPEVFLGLRGLPEDPDAEVGLGWIEAQDQSAVPGSQIDPLVGSDVEGPGAGAVGGVELARLAGVGIDLDEEELPAELIEIEVERFTAAPVGSNETAHETSGPDGDSKEFRFGGATWPR